MLGVCTACMVTRLNLECEMLGKAFKVHLIKNNMPHLFVKKDGTTRISRLPFNEERSSYYIH